MPPHAPLGLFPVPVVGGTAPAVLVGAAGLCLALVFRDRLAAAVDDWVVRHGELTQRVGFGQ